MCLSYTDRTGRNRCRSRRCSRRGCIRFAAPDFLAAHHGISALPDLLGKTLLHLDGGGNLWGAVDWPIWLESQGVIGKTARSGIRLNSYPMVIQAAESGRGIALGWSYIVDDLVACGRLARPLKEPSPQARRIILAHPKRPVRGRRLRRS